MIQRFKKKFSQIKSESEHKGGAVPGVSDDEMWHAQFMVDSAVHPDTNELVPKPFRMAGYVPCNIPILVGLLIPQGVAMTAFWVSLSAISQTRFPETTSKTRQHRTDGDRLVVLVQGPSYKQVYSAMVESNTQCPRQLCQ